MPTIQVSDDEREATLVLAPGERLGSSQALIALSRQRVRYGHLPKALATLPDLVGPLALVVAAAEPPEPPQDARLELPAGNMAFGYAAAPGPDGALAYPHPPVPARVAPGDVVAVKVPARPGHPGRTVTGKPLGVAPPSPRDFQLLAGPGCEVSPCGDAVLATAAGNVVCEAGVVFVRPELRIEGDLTFAEGDLSFDGNVLVTGSVEPGRRIEASGDVTVLGVVVGATIVAGRRVVVHGGVRHDARLMAGTDVLAQFIEGSAVHAGDRVWVREDLTQAHVDAARQLSVGGCVVGGSVQVQERLEADALGSAMAAPTRVAVVPPPPPPDPRPALAAGRKELQATLSQVWIRVEEAQRVLARTGAGQRAEEAAEMLEKLLELYKGLRAKDEGIAARMAAYAGHEPPTVRPTIQIRGGIHPGVSLQLGHAMLRAETDYPASDLFEADGVVRLVPLAPTLKGSRA